MSEVAGEGEGVLWMFDGAGEPEVIRHGPLAGPEPLDPPHAVPADLTLEVFWTAPHYVGAQVHPGGYRREDVLNWFRVDQGSLSNQLC